MGTKKGAQSAEGYPAGTRIEKDTTARLIDAANILGLRVRQWRRSAEGDGKTRRLASVKVAEAFDVVEQAVQAIAAETGLDRRREQLLEALVGLFADACASESVLADIRRCDAPSAGTLADQRLRDMHHSPNGNALVAARAVLEAEGRLP